jgi:hypothetical protein
MLFLVLRSVMALIRGLKGLYPCPMCLVPQEQQSDLSQIFPLRTQQGSEALFHQAQALNRVEDKERLLKSQSLRMVKVCSLCLIHQVRVLNNITNSEQHVDS